MNLRNNNGTGSFKRKETCKLQCLCKMHRCVELWSIECVRDKVRDTDSDYVLSIATKIVPAGPVRGILQGGHQVFSTILMYTEKRGRGTILVAIESNEKAIAVLARRRSEILERCGKLFSFQQFC